MNLAEFLSVAEHAHYPFKSYPRQKCKTVLFPGCAFPSQFPKTMDALSLLCREAGLGVAFDCCGNPLEGFGRQRDAERIINNLNRRFKDMGCERIVLVCPNCWHYLTGKVDCEVISVFDLFEELGVRNVDEFAEGGLFIPCPDKKQRILEAKLRSLYDLSEVTTITSAPCCGLRPDLAKKGPEYSTKLGRKVIEKAEGRLLYTYCASCLGQFSRLGYDNCRHVVSVVLGIDEPADSKRALANRAKRKFDRNVEPLM